jgi:DNA polymerase-3 subunit delta'
MDTAEASIVVEPHYLPWHRPVLERINALKSQQRLPHAILLDSSSEQDGAEFLWGLSMLLLCDEAAEGEPCGKCRSCEMMLANTYPDFKYITLQINDKNKKLNKNINVEQISKLIHEVNLTGLYDKLKIFAIHPADRMNIGSANRLLKTLEEPGEKVLFLLLTHRKGKLPVTIRSRCQIWSLDHPEKSDAQYWLLGQGMDAEEIDQYLDFASGDPQLALKLQSEGYAGIVEQFKQQFGQYLRNEIDVATVGAKVVAMGAPLARRLMKMVINAYCYQFSGVDSGDNVLSGQKKRAAQGLLILSSQIDRQLMIEENNLNFQNQLEDVLISLKQNIKRSKD